MTREQLKDAVVDALRKWCDSRSHILTQGIVTHDTLGMFEALKALDAHTEADADAETVTLGLIRARLSGQWAATEQPEQEDPRDWIWVGNLTFTPPAIVLPTIPATVTRERGA